jgi:hypothetical protein
MTRRPFTQSQYLSALAIFSEHSPPWAGGRRDGIEKEWRNATHALIDETGETGSGHIHRAFADGGDEVFCEGGITGKGKKLRRRRKFLFRKIEHGLREFAFTQAACVAVIP